MKVLLTKRNRIDGEAGEIVEVSPDRAAFLFSVEAAEPVKETREQVKPTLAEEAEEPAVLKKPAQKKPAQKKAKK